MSRLLLPLLLLLTARTRATCPGSPWREWQGHCYRLSHPQVLWHGARGECKLFFRGADLASVRSNAENQFIKNTLAQGQAVWLGMRAVNNALSWLDSSKVQYKNFAVSRPRTKGAEDVVTMESSGKWRFAASHTAGARRAVCKMRSCSCPAGWREWDRRCYRAVNQPRSWVEARQHCRQLHPTADLVSIINQRENNFVFGLQQQRPFWIGLNSREKRDQYTWSNGDPHRFRAWHPPTEPSGGWQCVQMQQNKLWSDVECYATPRRLRRPYVCEMIICGRSQKIQPSPVRGRRLRLHDSAVGARCPAGWSRGGTTCYRLPRTSATFVDAQRQCRQLHPSARIATVDGIADNDHAFFAGSSLPMWVDYGSRSGRAAAAARRRRAPASMFTYWEPGVVSARSADSDCAAMQNSSQWRPLRCQQDKLRGLCELPACTRKCGIFKAYTEFQGHCYRMLPQRRTRQQQQQICQREGGDLASISSQLENDFVAALAFPSAGDYNTHKKQSRQTWIGATHAGTAGGDPAAWRWSDCSPWSNHWWQSAPTRRDNAQCATLLFNGRWGHKVNCRTDKFSAVCEMDPCAKQLAFAKSSTCRDGKMIRDNRPTPAPATTKPAPQTTKQTPRTTTPAPLATRPTTRTTQATTASPDRPSPLCPFDWRLHNGYCYMAEREPATFVQALQTCTDTFRPAQMASVHKQADQRTLLELTGGSAAWLGLTAAFDFPAWTWLDGSNATGFQAWAAGQPAGDRANMELCAALDDAGAWSSLNCLSAERTYVCQLPAVRVSSTCPDTTSWRQEGGDCYLFHRDGASFSDAKTSCAGQQGSRLPAVRSARQQAALMRLANGHVVRLGLSNDWPDGSWRWQDGSLPQFSGWLRWPPPAGQGQGAPLCASLDGRRNGWVVQECTDRVPFFCQLETDSQAP